MAARASQTGNVAVIPAAHARSPSHRFFAQLRANWMAAAGGVIVALLLVIAIFVDTTLFSWVIGREVRPLLAPYHYAETDFLQTNAPPGAVGTDRRHYLLGTDYLGRDTLSRTLYGTRISLAVAMVAAAMSLVVGVLYGVIAGYGNAALDNGMMRFVDFLYGFPLIIFIILMQVYFKAAASAGNASPMARFVLRIDTAFGGIFLIFVGIGLVSWLNMARLARGQTLACKNMEYIQAARAIGSRDRRILRRHVLPNIIGPCIVAESLAIPTYILLETFLSFIGLGANPPTPSWGIMIAETYPSLRVAPFTVFVPAVALTLTTLAFNFLGDGLRDALDPTFRARR